jgi:hypothetical protein
MKLGEHSQKWMCHRLGSRGLPKRTVFAALNELALQRGLVI